MGKSLSVHHLRSSTYMDEFLIVIHGLFFFCDFSCLENICGGAYSLFFVIQLSVFLLIRIGICSIIILTNWNMSLLVFAHLFK